ncbi:MAG: WecB/TagA/CpsF family glycosyltransferase [Halieaceae bacterium]|jgi:N-acetylglucosaminyldiphosphoundecaprenol N-acetyl-beta-D-mannosaminyltransferase|nr:WecB/TagA/CpsF family glycosyltransferase [Halieaceae bacterium]
MSRFATRTVRGFPAANDAVSRERFNALGIPIDNLDMDSAVEQIVDLVYRFPRERRARYVSTVNVDFLVNALGMAGGVARHPELLEVLRSSDIVTADGFPVVMLSRLMGAPLQSRVTGADLVPALAERAARDGLRLYLLGGREEIARRAADLLEARYPGLEIAGVESPMVHTQGEGLMTFEEDDERIIEDINRSGADILLIGLGNPKQEQWFWRHRDRLKVPVSIGIGGTFEFIAGTVKRAPRWVQRANLEWLFRITQDPKRLWKRYAEGLFKLGLLVAPLLRLRARELMLTRVWGKQRAPAPVSWTYLSGPNRAQAATVALPRVVTASTLETVLQDMQQVRRRDTLFLLDFSSTRRLELAAMQPMFELGRQAAAGASHAVFIGIGRGLRRQLSAWRILDLFEGDQLSAESVHEPLALHQQAAYLPLRFYATDNTLVVYLHGDIDSQLLRRSGLDSVLSLVKEHQNCIVDLRFARLLESSAVVTLYRLAKGLGEDRLLLAGVQGSVRRMFDVAGMPRPLQLINDNQQRKLMTAA